MMSVVYTFALEGKIIYVGSGSESRPSASLKNSHIDFIRANKEKIEVDVSPIMSKARSRVLEAFLIQKLKPRCNKRQALTVPDLDIFCMLHGGHTLPEDYLNPDTDKDYPFESPEEGDLRRKINLSKEDWQARKKRLADNLTYLGATDFSRPKRLVSYLDEPDIKAFDLKDTANEL
jgi:hypothetical protein